MARIMQDLQVGWIWLCLSVVGVDNKPIWMHAEKREEDGKNNAGPAGWLRLALFVSCER